MANSQTPQDVAVDVSSVAVALEVTLSPEELALIDAAFAPSRPAHLWTWPVVPNSAANG
jgi:hypothetical protein